jgi:hypothetical protein
MPLPEVPTAYDPQTGQPIVPYAPLVNIPTLNLQPRPNDDPKGEPRLVMPGISPGPRPVEAAGPDQPLPFNTAVNRPASTSAATTPKPITTSLEMTSIARPYPSTTRRLLGPLPGAQDLQDSPSTGRLAGVSTPQPAIPPEGPSFVPENSFVPQSRLPLRQLALPQDARNNQLSTEQPPALSPSADTRSFPTTNRQGHSSTNGISSASFPFDHALYTRIDGGPYDDLFHPVQGIEENKMQGDEEEDSRAKAITE